MFVAWDTCEWQNPSMNIHMAEPIFFLGEAFTTELAQPWFDPIRLMRCRVCVNAKLKCFLIGSTDDEIALVKITGPFKFDIWRKLVNGAFVLGQFRSIEVDFATLVTSLLVDRVILAKVVLHAYYSLKHAYTSVVLALDRFLQMRPFHVIPEQSLYQSQSIQL